MPTRKQRRRELKSKRHQYEFVYVDAEGNELDDPPEGFEEQTKPATRTNGKAAAATQSKGRGQQPRGKRGGRVPQPPSWQRAARRALILGAVVFALFYVGGGRNGHRVLGAAGLAALYTLLFVPFTYVVDRYAYNRYQRRLEQGGSAARSAKPRSTRR
jgi:hypothetical protein